MTRATASVGDTVIANSDDVVVVEGFVYFRLDDVTPGVLTPTAAKSLCIWKGIASYYRVDVGDVSLRNAAWTYRHPSPLARRVKDRVAFWGGVEVRVTDASRRPVRSED